MKYAPTIANPVSSLKNPCAFRLASCLLGLRLLSRTLYKSPLFMQNKPNFRKSQMNVSNYTTTEYEQMDTWSSGKNKPNQTQYNPNTNPIPLRPKTNASFLPTKGYATESAFSLQENKPNQTQSTAAEPLAKPDQTRSEAEIPAGELLEIRKPGTNRTQFHTPHALSPNSISPAYILSSRQTPRLPQSCKNPTAFCRISQNPANLLQTTTPPGWPIQTIPPRSEPRTCASVAFATLACYHNLFRYLMQAHDFGTQCKVSSK